MLSRPGGTPANIRSASGAKNCVETIGCQLVKQTRPLAASLSNIQASAAFKLKTNFIQILSPSCPLIDGVRFDSYFGLEVK